MVNYAYDGLGTLLSRENSVSGSVYYLNNGQSTLLESGSVDFAAPTKYTLGAGGLLGQINPDATAQYFYYDALGSMGAIGDQAGNITSSYRYDPWGTVIQQTGSSETNRNYVGKYGVTEEPEDGLSHMGARFYDPSTGAFLQTDPVMGSIGNPLSMVPYIYAWNDPVNLIDPNGEMPSSGWFLRKQREWATTAQRLQQELNSKGFIGSNGRKLSIDGKYGENTRWAHWNYYMFRELTNTGYYPNGESYRIKFKNDKIKEFRQWFGGKITSISVKDLQGYLKKKNAKGFNGETVKVDGQFGGITRQAVIMQFWEGAEQIKAANTHQGTRENKKPTSTTSTTPKSPTAIPKEDTGSGSILPDAVGIRWSQSASAGGGVAASQDILVSKNGANVYGSVEGNVGAQSGGDLSSQLVLAWGTPDGIAGSYTSVNATVVAGIGIDIQYSWSDTSKVFAIGPALGLQWQASVGKGKTFR